MIYAKTNPTGLDAVIATVQTKLMTLETLWGVELDGYPRCYPTERNGKKGVEHYVGVNEYSGNLIVGERNKFFFTAESRETTTDFKHYSADCELYFVVDLPQCKPQITHRGDQEVRTDVLFILDNMSGVKVKEVWKDVEDVFNGFDYEYASFMHPKHAFRITFEAIGFFQNQTNCT